LQEKRQVEVSEDRVLRLVQEQRRYQPRLGGKKLYKLLGEDLHQLGRSMGRDKFFDILRDKDLLVKRKRKFQKTTNSYHRFWKYKNLLKDKTLTAPHQAYVSDITYLRTKEKFVYLFLITDAYSRMIVGWSVSQTLGLEGALEAAGMAISRCPDTTGLIHHSDRGFQYCCPQYVKRLLDQRMLISMTEENHCYENAIAERVNGILKDEFLLDSEMANLEKTRKAVKQAITTYNTRRPHWSLQLRIPANVHHQNNILEKSKKRIKTIRKSVH
jgi:transposase InsO family protein